MKNPGFLTNGTIVVLKPSDTLGNINTVAVIVGRYEKVVEGQPEFVALPIVLNPDEEEITKVLTQNNTMASFISVFNDEVISVIDVADIDKYEWVITHTINHIIDTQDSKSSKHVKKLENTLMEALEEKNFIKFKWIIFNKQLRECDLIEWSNNIRNSKRFYVEFFEVKEKEIDNCLSKLEKLLEEVQSN